MHGTKIRDFGDALNVLSAQFINGENTVTIALFIQIDKGPGALSSRIAADSTA